MGVISFVVLRSTTPYLDKFALSHHCALFRICQGWGGHEGGFCSERFVQNTSPLRSFRTDLYFRSHRLLQSGPSGDFAVCARAGRRHARPWPF